MSVKAVERSIEFAKIFGSEIILLYVVDERYAPPSSLLSFISSRTSLKEAKTNLRRVLESGAEPMLERSASRIKENGLLSEKKIRVGSPAKEIIEAAKEIKCDMIIMGSERLKSNKLRALGSVARKVVETAPCPVMLVR